MSELRVLFLTRYPYAGASSRYRVYQYLPYLEDLGVTCTTQSFMDPPLYNLSFSRGKNWKKLWLTAKAISRRLSALRDYKKFDIIYMQRELFPILPPIVEKYLAKHHPAVIFDYDDALFIQQISRYNRVIGILKPRRKIEEILHVSHCVVAGNNWLRDKAREYGAHAVTIEVAEDTNRIPMHRTHSNAATLAIGWLGSSSTAEYLQLIAPALRKIAAHYPDLQFHMMGGGKFSMPGVPWQEHTWSLEGELQLLSHIDIGLMPLPDNDWALGKSGGKARTYMAAGVVPVCTSIGYNLELINHNETGILCSTIEDWYLDIIRLLDSASLRQIIATKARRDIELRFSPSRQASLLRQTFDEIISRSHRE